MYSERSAPTIDVALGAAPGLTLFVASTYALAIAAVATSGLAPWLRLCLAIGLAALGAHWVIHTGLRLGSRSLARVVLYPDDECTLVQRSGRTLTARMISGMVITSCLAVVTVRSGRHWISVPVSAGATDPEAFRKLRVRLMIAPPARGFPHIRQLCANALRWLMRRRENDRGG